MPKRRSIGPTLHVFGQSYWHTPLVIVGDALGLEALGSAIVKAMASGEAEETAFQNDGESYPIQVIMLDEPSLSAVPCAYEADVARDPDHYPAAVYEAIGRIEAARRKE